MEEMRGVLLPQNGEQRGRIIVLPKAFQDFPKPIHIECLLSLGAAYFTLSTAYAACRRHRQQETRMNSCRIGLAFQRRPIGASGDSFDIKMEEFRQPINAQHVVDDSLRINMCMTINHREHSCSSMDRIILF
jgi:hypothetical protein